MNEIKQDTPAWHAMRENRIGASDCAAILNVSPWDTPYSLWETKLGLRPPKEMNWAMSEGKRKEENGRQRLQKLIGKDIMPDVIIHPTFEYLMCSLDGITKDRQLICEIKFPGKKDHEEALSGLVPEKYYPQVQMQMECSGLPVNHYFSCYGEDACVVVVERNRAFIDKMMPLLHDFYKCMVTLKPPELTERDYQDKSNDQDFYEISYQYKIIAKELAILQGKQEAFRDRLIELSNDRNCRGNGVSVRKSVRVGAIKYKEIEVLKEIDLEKHRGPPITTWTINTEKNK
jgi:putative phage-type endonuclease